MATTNKVGSFLHSVLYNSETERLRGGGVHPERSLVPNNTDSPTNQLSQLFSNLSVLFTISGAGNIGMKGESELVKAAELVILPRLPPEIQLKIFTIAARLDERETALKLIKVARYVREWIEPVMYESIYLRTPEQADAFCRLLKSRRSSSNSLAHAVKTLFFGDIGGSALIAACQLCPNAEALFTESNIRYELYGHLRLKHLGFRPVAPRKMAYHDFFALPTFEQLTHLELYNYQFKLPLGCLPSLTHLAIGRYCPEAWKACLGELNATVAGCKSLRCLLLMSEQDFMKPGYGMVDDAVLEYFAEVGEPVGNENHLTGKEKMEEVLSGVEFFGVVIAGVQSKIGEDWENHLKGVNIWERWLEVGMVKLL